MPKIKKCPHAYYDKVAMTSLCDYYCIACSGYRKACGQGDKARRGIDD